ncbi:MAG: cytochrome c, partial [Bacteroidota bacterium]
SNSFDCPEKGSTVKLNLLPILTKADMVKYEAYTVSKDGRYLESGGMFYLDIDGAGMDQGVEVSLPTDHIDDRMQVFIASDDGLQWEVTNQDLQMTGLAALEEGETLYDNHCASCHPKKLDMPLTGPPLGNVTEFRNLDWLIAFTKNSQQMIADGDSISVCLWENWKPTVMNDFDHLSDEQIKLIYRFIANESKKQGIGLDEINYTLNCDYSAVIERSNNLPQDTSSWMYSSPQITESFDTTDVYKFRLLYPTWYNVDYFLYTEDEVENLRVRVEGDPANLTLLLIFKHRNVVIPFQRTRKGDYLLLNANGKDQINFPQEKVQIIGYRANPKTGVVTQYIEREYSIQKTGNNLTLELKEIPPGVDFYDLILN